MRRLGAAACFIAAAAHGAEPAPLAREVGVDRSQERVPSSVFEDVVVAPIPISNPTVGTGLAVVVMPFYHLGPESPLSNTAVAAGYTSSGSWAVGATQTTRLRGDERRIDGMLALHRPALPLLRQRRGRRQRRPVGTDRAESRGVRSGAACSRSAAALSSACATAASESIPPSTVGRAPRARAEPDFTGTIASSGIGPVAVFDTRDNEMSPASGWLADFRGNFAEQSFGSDTSYQTFTLGVNHYRRVGPGVLALRAFACGASDRTPLFDLCLYGSGTDLRGYESAATATAAWSPRRPNIAFRSPAASAARCSPAPARSRPRSANVERALAAQPGRRRALARVTKARVNLSFDIARGRDETTAYIYVKGGV